MWQVSEVYGEGDVEIPVSAGDGGKMAKELSERKERYGQAGLGIGRGGQDVYRL